MIWFPFLSFRFAILCPLFQSLIPGRGSVDTGVEGILIVVPVDGSVPPAAFSQAWQVCTAGSDRRRTCLSVGGKRGTRSTLYRMIRSESR